jgi:integration host factor subunit beta
VTKSELIEVVAEEAKLTKGRAELVINTIFEAMVEALSRGEGIEIRGFGSFTVRQYKAYEGRNPRTGEPVHVSPKRLPFFRVGKELRERVDGTCTEALGARGGASAGGEPARPTGDSTRPQPPPPDDDPSEDVI